MQSWPTCNLRCLEANAKQTCQGAQVRRKPCLPTRDGMRAGVRRPSTGPGQPSLHSFPSSPPPATHTGGSPPSPVSRLHQETTRHSKQAEGGPAGGSTGGNAGGSTGGNAGRSTGGNAGRSTVGTKVGTQVGAQVERRWECRWERRWDIQVAVYLGPLLRESCLGGTSGEV